MGHYNEEQTWAFMCQRREAELEYRLSGETLKWQIKGGEQIAKRVHPFFVNEELVGVLVEIRGRQCVCDEVRVRDFESGITLHKPCLKPPQMVGGEWVKPALATSSVSTQTCLPLLKVGTSAFV